jgi:hypothetical protein
VFDTQKGTDGDYVDCPVCHGSGEAEQKAVKCEACNGCKYGNETHGSECGCVGVTSINTKIAEAIKTLINGEVKG